jgi:hypothetical protein
MLMANETEPMTAAVAGRASSAANPAARVMGRRVFMDQSSFERAMMP